MISGCDLSNHNKTNYSAIIKNNAFVVIKATEGKTYKDPYMKKIADEAVKQKKLIGFYHFARPENGNTYKEEADNFIAAVGPYIGNAILVLDYEGDAHKCGSPWAKKWIQYVYKKTGVLPLFYTSESYLAKYKSVAKTGCGLWVAKYSTQKPNTGAWPFWALWQRSSAPYDKDYFNGPAGAWMAYARIAKKVK